MFTGIVEGKGRVVRVERRGADDDEEVDASASASGGRASSREGGPGPEGDAAGGLRLAIRLGALADGVRVGDSIAVSGCCLTVVALERDVASFDAVPETLARTWLGDLAAGRDVNIERSLRLGDRLDGHLVQGHIDGTAVVAERRQIGGRWGEARFAFECAPGLTESMVPKGSVAIDGVSLTLVEVRDGHFAVAVIPHTLQLTSFGHLEAGDRVHVETDVFGKWFLKAVGPYVDALKRRTG